MTIRNVTIHAAALVLLIAGSASAQKVEAASAKPVKCTNPAIEVTILSGALVDDGKGPYQDGVSGVYNAVVYACQGASGDATMGLITSRRSIGFTFPAPIDGSNNAGDAPAWANGVKFYAKPFMNVRNILWGRKNGGVTIFTTRMGFSYINGPGDSKGNRLRPPIRANQPASDSQVPGSEGANVPDQTVAVTVVDNPRNCQSGGSVLDSWTVTVDSPFVSGLVLISGNANGSPVPSGQYSMPFQLLIKAKTCLPF